MNIPVAQCFVGFRSFYQVGVLYQASVHICLIKATRLAEMFHDWCAYSLFDLILIITLIEILWTNVQTKSSSVTIYVDLSCCSDNYWLWPHYPSICHWTFYLSLCVWGTWLGLPSLQSLALSFMPGVCLHAGLFHTWWLPLWLRDIV